MDLSLATDSYGSAYLHQHHHLQQQQQQQQQHQQQQQQTQQQQQQQQQQQPLQHNQPQQQAPQHPQHHHYPYHHSQHHQALSLAPPSGKGFFDLEYLEHAGASSSLGLGHLPPSSSYQQDYGLYAPGVPAPAASTAAALPSHHSMMPSHSPGQLWGRNSTNANAGHVGAAQHLQYSPAQAAAATAHILHSTGYSSGSHSLGDSAQFSSLHGWGTEPHRSQWPQHAWDNCLPPGVEPSSTPATTNSMFPHVNASLPHSQSHLHSSLHCQPYRQLPQYVPHGMHMRTGRSPQKPWPKRKPSKGPVRKIPVVKTTAMKETGAPAPRAVVPDSKGPGWCFVCQRNCVTEVALKQHLEGKGHKRQVELQKDRAEVAAKTAEEDGGVANMLEQVWMQVTMMGKSTRKTGKGKRRPKAKDEGKDVQPIDVPNSEGEPANVKTGGVKAPNENKVVEMVRCDICNVECNSKAVLEIHFGGKKHAARLKKLQESGVGRKREQPTSISNPEQPTLISNTEQAPLISNSEQATLISDEQPTFISDMEQPTLISDMEQPTLISAEQPISDMEQPTLISDEQPISNTEQPTLISNLEQPTVIDTLEQPTVISNLEQSTLMSNPEQPTVISSPEQPTSMSKPEQPNMIISLEQSTSISQ